MVANKASTPPTIFYLHVLMHIMYIMNFTIENH